MNAVLMLSCLWIAAVAADAAPVISAAQRDADGFLSHTISSPYQPGETTLRVLLPDGEAKGGQSASRLPVVYVLPVEARDERRYGDGLLEVRGRQLHNKHRAIFVAPNFAQLPWYADHPDDLTVQQESYLVRAVLPLLEKTYPAIAEPRGRLLLGFSKSGWGAWTLLVRHPKVFGRAAAWDAPLVTMQFGKFQSGPIFGSDANYARYNLPRLLHEHGSSLGPEPRLILLGKGSFADDTAATHRLLESLSIPHAYLDGPVRKHDWHSGWVSEAVDLLLSPSLQSAP